MSVVAVIWRRGAVAAPAMALRPPPTAAPMPAPCPPPAIAPITAPVPAPTRPPPSARYAGLYGSAKAVVAQHQSCADHAGHDRLLCHSLSTEKPRRSRPVDQLATEIPLKLTVQRDKQMARVLPFQSLARRAFCPRPLQLAGRHGAALVGSRGIAPSATAGSNIFISSRRYGAADWARPY